MEAAEELDSPVIIGTAEVLLPYGPIATRKRVDLISRLGNEEVAAYEILSADRLVEAYGKGELKGGLKEIAAGLDEESNPVLMLVKHKR